jgi:hypothetical protein
MHTAQKQLVGDYISALEVILNAYTFINVKERRELIIISERTSDWIYMRQRRRIRLMLTEGGV